MKKIFSLDLDNMLVDFTKSFSAYVANHNIDIPSSNKDVTSYSYGLHPEVIKYWVDEFGKNHGYENLELLEPSHKDYLLELDRKYTLLFVTARGTHLKKFDPVYSIIKNDTYHNLRSLGFKYPSIRHAKDKTLLSFDYHVDDSPYEYEKFKDAGCLHKFILYRQPYNKHITDCNVIQSIKELENYE